VFDWWAQAQPSQVSENDRDEWNTTDRRRRGDGRSGEASRHSPGGFINNHHYHHHHHRHQPSTITITTSNSTNYLKVHVGSQVSFSTRQPSSQEKKTANAMMKERLQQQCVKCVKPAKIPPTWPPKETGFSCGPRCAMQPLLNGSSIRERRKTPRR